MKIKILGINCSPRHASNSGKLLLRSFEKAVQKHPGELEYEIVDLREKDIRACLACDVCGKSKDDGHFLDCVQARKDDVQEILDKMMASHGIAIATPVYFGLPTDLFSRFVMRTRVLRHQDFALANRVVGVMSIAGRRSGGGETTIFASWLPFIRNGCLIVGNGDQTSQFGAVCWAGARGHIMSDEWGLEQGIQVVDRIFNVAKLIQAGSKITDYKNPMTFSYGAGIRK